MPLINYSSLYEHFIIGGVLTTIFLISNYSMHRIEEGHVGVYFRVSSWFKNLINVWLNKGLKHIKYLYRTLKKG